MFCASGSGSSVSSACERAALLVPLLVGFIAWHLHSRNTIIVASQFSYTSHELSPRLNFCFGVTPYDLFALQLHTRL